MFNTKEKKERALGTKLFLKAGRCNSPKCVTIRRPYRPGLHGKSRRRGLSEFGQQLNEKQKIRFSYGLRESQLKKTFLLASRNPGVTGEVMLELLERRLDNVVFRLGLALSRSIARQLVNHGHIMVNDKKVTIPSYCVRIGDKISIRLQSKDNPVFSGLSASLKKYEPPVWLNIDKEKFEGKVMGKPKEFKLPFDINMVVDYYSKQ